MPNIKLPYTEEGMDLADKIQDKIEEVGGEVSSEYPTMNAQDRMQNTAMPDNPVDAGNLGDLAQSLAGSSYKKGGKAKKNVFRERSSKEAPFLRKHGHQKLKNPGTHGRRVKEGLELSKEKKEKSVFTSKKSRSTKAKTKGWHVRKENKFARKSKKK